MPEDFADRITQLLQAVSAGDEQKTRELIEADPRLVSATEESSQMTVLHIAATSGDTALVELLLAHGADPNALDKGDNASPLHHAAERGRLEVVKLLVAAGADVNWDLDLHQRGPLGWAVVFGSPKGEVAEFLVSKGAKFDIFSATAMGRIHVVRDLVANEPGLLRQRMSRFENFISPIEFATSQRQWEIAELLAELGSDLSISDAAGLGREELLAKRLEEDPPQSILNWALKVAVKGNQLGTAKQLMQKGADPNYARDGTSLLFDSIGTKDAEMSRLLIEHGADLEFKDAQWKSSPIGWQVFFGLPEQTQLALDLGAEVGQNLVELAEAGERGELRRWSAGTALGYRLVADLLRKHLEERSR